MIYCKLKDLNCQSVEEEQSRELGAGLKELLKRCPTWVKSVKLAGVQLRHVRKRLRNDKTFISSHFISFHFISFHFISFHFISEPGATRSFAHCFGEGGPTLPKQLPFPRGQRLVAQCYALTQSSIALRTLMSFTHAFVMFCCIYST